MQDLRWCLLETKNTVFYNRKLSEDQTIIICKLLVERNGVRAIELNA